MTSWPTVRLLEVLDRIVDNRGRTAPTIESGGVALIATDCIKETGLFPIRKNLRYVSDETYKTWFRGHPEPGDVIITNKGTPGLVCQVPPVVDFCIAQDMVSLRPNRLKVTPNYLLAALRGPEFKHLVESLHVGTLIPHLKKGDFDKLTIPLPPMPVQQVIGDVYCSLSEKIELNRRMNRTLEQAAGAIFKSWFVDFEPIRAKSVGARTFVPMPQHAFEGLPMAFADSAMGQIPLGWVASSVGEECELVMGQSPPSETYNDKGEGLPFHQGVGTFGERYPRTETYCTIANRVAESGDVLFSVRAPVGRINVADRTLILGRGVAGLRHRLGWQTFLLYHLKHSFQIEDSIGSGINLAATQHTTNGVRFDGPKVNLSDLWSDKVSVRLDVTYKILAWAATIPQQLECAQILPLGVLDQIRDLNRKRNFVKHSQAMSSTQYKKAVEECVDEVVDVLRALEGLSAVKLYRFHGSDPEGSSASDVQLVDFTGSGTDLTLQPRAYSSREYAKCSMLLNKSRVLIEFGGVIASASPFYYPKDDATGHKVQLSAFKKREGGGFGGQLIGSAEPALFDAARCREDENWLRAVFGEPPLP